MVGLPTLSQREVEDAVCLLRCDLDVPLVNGAIEDPMRLIASLPTIEYLLMNRSEVIGMGHLGRPTHHVQNPEELDLQDPSFGRFSLFPVAKWLSQRLRMRLKGKRKGGFYGWSIGGSLFLLENIRFYQGEEKNDESFAKKLASLAHIYVNDAFAVSHRTHASVVGITRFIPHVAGFHLLEEVRFLESVLYQPRRPLVIVMGGKKIETKLPLLHKMAQVADYVLVGGKIAQEAEKVFDKNNISHWKRIILARQNKSGTDITRESVEKFAPIIQKANMIVWNGSMGIISEKLPKEDSERGTREIAQAIARAKAITIVGGGDTVEYLNRLKMTDRFSFVSTGGGAMLALLSGEKLPGLVALTT